MRIEEVTVWPKLIPSSGWRDIDTQLVLVCSTRLKRGLPKWAVTQQLYWAGEMTETKIALSEFPPIWLETVPWALEHVISYLVILTESGGTARQLKDIVFDISDMSTRSRITLSLLWIFKFDSNLIHWLSVHNSMMEGVLVSLSTNLNDPSLQTAIMLI